MELRQLEIDLSATEYTMLCKDTIHGQSKYSVLLRRLQPYVNHELKYSKATRGIRLKIVDPQLIEFCVRNFRPCGNKKGGFKARSKELLAHLELSRKGRADEKDRHIVSNAIAGSKTSIGNNNSV
jgi:hypothetical protein